MKKILFFISVLMLISCKKENSAVINRVQPDVITKGIEDVNVGKLNPEATKYYSNISNLLFLSLKESKTQKSSLKSSFVDSQGNSVDTSGNSILKAFVEMNIEKENGDSISFFNLDSTNQKTFINTWIKVEAEALTAKIDSDKLAMAYIKAQNDAYDQAVKEDSSNMLKSSKSVKGLINKIGQKIEELKNPKSSLKSGIILWQSDNTVTVQNFMNRLKRGYQRGRVIVVLPGGGPYTGHVIASFVGPTWGHASFCIADNSYVNNKSTWTDNDQISLGAWPEGGVQNEYLSKYKCGAYLLAVYDVKWVWKWKGWSSRFYQELREVNNEATANRALQYNGKPYTFDIPFAKWAAPDKFICTTLVWWSIKREHGINIDHWYTTTVLPVDIYESENMRVKAATFN